MQKGFGKIEGIIMFIIFGAFFLVGAYSVYLIYKPTAVLSLIMVLYLWFYLHRIRVCNFCDQQCPYRPKRKLGDATEPGFRKIEKILFYPIFIIIIALYLTTLFYLNLILGTVMSILLMCALVRYRLKICPNCQIPCPFNPNKKKSASVEENMPG